MCTKAPILGSPILRRSKQNSKALGETRRSKDESKEKRERRMETCRTRNDSSPRGFPPERARVPRRLRKGALARWCRHIGTEETSP